jgi:hypothetical protein
MHGLIADFRDWPYSSYHTLHATQPTRLRRDEVLAWFGDPAEFAAAHRRCDDDTPLQRCGLEDFDSSSRRRQTLRVLAWYQVRCDTSSRREGFSSLARSTGRKL